MLFRSPSFTLVGATTKAGNVSSPLISRFGIVERFSYYSNEELALIIERSSAILSIEIEKNAALLLASCARGTPRVANRLLRRMRDFAQVAGKKSIDKALVKEALKKLEIDSLGLEKHDRDILKTIMTQYGGGPVGADTLSISIGESVDTLEDYYEPYLIQAGLIQRTSRGRIVTAKAYEHLGMEGKPPLENERLLF